MEYRSRSGCSDDMRQSSCQKAAVASAEQLQGLAAAGLRSHAWYACLQRRIALAALPRSSGRVPGTKLPVGSLLCNCCQQLPTCRMHFPCDCSREGFVCMAPGIRSVHEMAAAAHPQASRAALRGGAGNLRRSTRLASCLQPYICTAEADEAV